jgi:hypothetical protein
MAASITLSIRLGPMVSLRISGQSCQELAKALEGYDELNVRIDSMCGNLAERIYPEGLDLDDLAGDKDEEEEIREDQ